MVSVSPDEKVFPVFTGMPQGWSWALHLCNSAVEHIMSKVIEPKQFVREGRPAPDLRRGPVGAVYVDNLGVLGLLEKLVHQNFDDAVCKLEDAGFVLHELERGSVLIVNVGVVVDRGRSKLRHTEARAWRLYLGLKYLLQMGKATSEVLRVFAGHLAHFFTLLRPAFSCLFYVYKFIHQFQDGGAQADTIKRTNSKYHLLPGNVKRELRVAIGLLFLAKVDLALPFADHMYCGDSSKIGYCLQVTPSSAEEQRPLFKFHERW